MKNNITTIINNVYEDALDDLLKLIAKKKFISFYVNGKRYFLFIFRGQVCHISEYSFCLIIAIAGFFGTLAVKKLIQHSKLKKKVRNVINELRGGSQLEILNFEKDLEKELLNNNNYPFLPRAFFDLTTHERFLKDIIKQCLKPNRIYRITDHGIIKILHNMIDYDKRDLVKIISYDAFVLALVVSAKSFNSLVKYDGTANIIAKFLPSVLISNLPLLSSGFLGVIAALRYNGPWTLNALTFLLGKLILGVTGSYYTTDMIRSQIPIDCQNYVQEVRQIAIESSSSLSIESSSSSESTLSYIREEPMKNDIFVSTTKEGQLHYQEDFEIETLDGKFKQVPRVSGERSLEWRRNRGEVVIDQSKYIPLETRTSTLADIVRSDSTEDRMSASQIINTIQKEQIITTIIDEALE